MQGPWVVVVVQPDMFDRSPYKIGKDPASADPGVYTAWFTDGAGQPLDLMVNSPSALASVGVDVSSDFLAPFPDTPPFTSLPTNTPIVIDFPQVGQSHARIIPPPGWTAVPSEVDVPVTCDARTSVTVYIRDLTPPTVSCVQSVNPSDKNVPQAHNQNQDGFYQVSASDLATPSPTISLGSYTLGNGETIKITQTPGQTGVTLVNDMGAGNLRHFRVGPGDATITATDAEGNSASATCHVPPPPQ